jgi:hypothetical protein
MPPPHGWPLGLIHKPQQPSVPLLGQRLRTADYQPRAAVDYHTAVKQWTDIGNLSAGDCVPAGGFHLAQMRMTNVWHSEWQPTAQQALALYTLLTGYDPTNGANDNGTDVDSFMAYWTSSGLDTGLQGNDVALHVALTLGNLDELRLGVDWFVGAGLSIAMPLAWQEATDVWDMPASGMTSAAGRPNGWGGHFVPTGRYDKDGFYVISWGKEFLITPNALLAYGLRYDTGFSPDTLTTAGRTLGGLSRDQAIAQMSVLAA